MSAQMHDTELNGRRKRTGCNRPPGVQ